MRKFWPMRVLLVVLIFCLAGSSLWSPVLAQSESTLDRVKRQGTLKIGLAQVIPGAYRDPVTGNWNGVHVKIMEMLCKEMGVKPQFIEVTWDLFPAALQKGDIDIFAGGAFATVKRALQVAFVRPTYEIGSLAMIRKEDADKYKRHTDFNKKGIRIAVMVGQYEEDLARRLWPQATVVAPKVLDSIELAELVRTGRADVWVGNETVVSWTAQHNPWSHVVDEERPFAANPNSYCVRYGDPDWLHFLDIFVDTIRSNGEVDRIRLEYANVK
jgi:ABC-type amino acid transport substrate-binding protein